MSQVSHPDDTSVERDLDAHPSAPSQARRLLRELLAGHDEDWVDTALIATSEITTNALVHAGTPMRLRARLDTSGLRVEVADGSPHLPVPRDYAATSGTGRGLRMVEALVDRWGSTSKGGTKVVWFELGHLGATPTRDDPAAEQGTEQAGVDADSVTVRLLNVPTLMHVAWQEHASTLLRELLLARLDEDPGVLERHAEASDALNVLYEQVPPPQLDEDPESLMANAIEPGVTAARLDIEVPRSSVPHFRTLDELLGEAVDLAETGAMLAPPTQPEIGELREWLCSQVLGQATDGLAPEPWRARTDVWTPMARRHSDSPVVREVAESDRALLATDEASVIIAVSERALRFLGYEEPGNLVGRRIIAVVPQRFHQAHIAGTTLHMTNGRSVLLARKITVPVLLAGGTERPVELSVEPRPLGDGSRFFLAEFFLED